VGLDVKAVQADVVQHGNLGKRINASPAARPHARRPGGDPRVRPGRRDRPWFAAGSVAAHGWGTKQPTQTNGWVRLFRRPATDERLKAARGCRGMSPGYSSGSVADRPAPGWSACIARWATTRRRIAGGPNESLRESAPGTPKVAVGHTDTTKNTTRSESRSGWNDVGTTKERLPERALERATSREKGTEI
jgi:hypothetical protein